MIEHPLQTLPSPWHAGEIRMQESVGVAERMAMLGPRVVRDHMTEQHRSFFEQLPFMVFGAIDPIGDVWATLIAGRPGFATAPEPSLLAFEHTLSADDPATAGFERGHSVGALGIELDTRRRNRMNGRIARRDDKSFVVAVDQSFGNCPKYIQLRDLAIVDTPEHGVARHLSALDQRARAIIAAADTFFVASYADTTAGGRQVDVSHRGGRAGFVRVGDDGRLTIPDFAGNLFFNTLGNLLLNGKAGLVFADFATGDVLQMTGRAEVILDSPEIATFKGAERLWTFAADKIVLREAALPFRGILREDGWSPKTLATGDWREAG